MKKKTIEFGFDWLTYCEQLIYGVTNPLLLTINCVVDLLFWQDHCRVLELHYGATPTLGKAIATMLTLGNALQACMCYAVPAEGWYKDFS